MAEKKQKRILVVEDESALSRVLSLKLVSAGYLADVAENGQEALDMISKNQYDTVLLDLILPVMDGFEVLEKLSGMKTRPNVVVLSNLSQSDDIERVKKLGATDFFVKSDIQLSQIIEYLNKHLK